MNGWMKASRNRSGPEIPQNLLGCAPEGLESPGKFAFQEKRGVSSRSLTAPLGVFILPSGPCQSKTS